jgi:hypothetical protein
MLTMGEDPLMAHETSRANTSKIRKPCEKLLLGLFFLCLFLVLTSCMPTTNTPNSEPIYYQGSITDVYASVVQAMSLSPGLDNSTGWIITQSDAAGHFIRAETLVTPVVLGIPIIIQKNNESVSVVVSQQDSKIQVLIQFTEVAKPLADFIKQQLDTTFQRVGQLEE